MADKKPIPEWERQKIAGLQCPPLVTTQELSKCKMDNLNKQMKVQQNKMAIIKQQIDNIKARFPIRFVIDNIKIVEQSEAIPTVDMSGSLPNPYLSMTVFYPEKGDDGIRGVPGDDGDSGEFGRQGTIGFDGYWGVQGRI